MVDHLNIINKVKMGCVLMYFQEIEKSLLDLYSQSKVDLIAYRYSSRLLNLVENALNKGENTIDLRDIGISAEQYSSVMNSCNKNSFEDSK
jgi:hypothetical protein